MHSRHRDRHGKQVEYLIRLLGNYLERRVLHPSGREQRHHCLPQDLGAILNHPKQLSPFPERLGEIMSGYEDVVSSSTDQFTTWVKTISFQPQLEHMTVVCGRSSGTSSVSPFRIVCWRAWSTARVPEYSQQKQRSSGRLTRGGHSSQVVRRPWGSRKRNETTSEGGLPRGATPVRGRRSSASRQCRNLLRT